MSVSETRERIKDAVLSLLGQTSIRDITVAEVARRAHVNRATFYRHYSNVRDVLLEIEDNFFEGFEQRAKEFAAFPLEEKYFSEPHPACQECLEFVEANRDLNLLLFGPHGDIEFRRRCEDITTLLLAGKIADEDTTRRFDKYTQAFLAGGQVNAILHWLSDEDRMSAAEFAVVSYRNLFGGYPFRA